MKKFKILSFKYAFEGLWTALKEEPNFLFHIFAGIVAIEFGYYFEITKTEWLVLMLTIGLVLSLELTNTAIEEIVDSFTDKSHPGAKKAKDVAAGAVLAAATTATVIGLIIFLPHFLKLLSYP